MSYEPTTWSDGDLITKEKLNKLENGVRDNAGVKGDTGAQGPKGDKGDTGPAGPAGKGVKSIALTKDSGGQITGGTVTFSDDSTSQITVTVSGG